MLTQPIQKKWFDMILEEDKDKRKKEEYRTLNEYWGKRFATALGFTGKDAVCALNKYIQSHGQTEEFTVRYRNGYSGNSPTAEAKVTLSIGPGKEEWGAEPGVQYYVQHILEVRQMADR